MEAEYKVHMDEQQDPIESIPYSVAASRTRRTIQALIRYGHEIVVAYALVIKIEDPSTYQEALAHKDKE